jgi:hypothetical protein
MQAATPDHFRGRRYLVSALKSLLADRALDADWIRAFVSEHDAWANIPLRRNRKER